MAFYKWKDEFSVGNKEMDAQHQKMIDILNHLHDAMKAGVASTEIMTIVNEMIAYTRYHFSSEEKLMAQSQYQNLASQKTEHAAFVIKSLTFQTEIQTGKLAVSLEVLNFLKDWWTNHILISDKQYAGKLG